MRIVYARITLGAGVLSDPRFPRVAELCQRQATARRIDGDKTIGEFLARMAPYWKRDHLPEIRRIEAELTSRPFSHAESWAGALNLILRSHRDRGGEASETEMRAFINAAYADAWHFGLHDQVAILRHVLLAEALGLRFFVDPQYPDWMAVYGSTDPRRIATAASAALSPEFCQRES